MPIFWRARKHLPHRIVERRVLESHLDPGVTAHFAIPTLPPCGSPTRTLNPHSCPHCAHRRCPATRATQTAWHIGHETVYRTTTGLTIRDCSTFCKVAASALSASTTPIVTGCNISSVMHQT